MSVNMVHIVPPLIRLNEAQESLTCGVPQARVGGILGGSTSCSPQGLATAHVNKH